MTALPNRAVLTRRRSRLIFLVSCYTTNTPLACLCHYYSGCGARALHDCSHACGNRLLRAPGWSERDWLGHIRSRLLVAATGQRSL